MAKKIHMKTLSDAELAKKLADTRVQLREHRFANAGSRPKDTNALAKGRKEIARVMTELTTRSK